MGSWKQCLAALTLLSSACSYAFGVAPHERSLSGTQSGCTTSRVPPLIDTALTIVAVALAASAAHDCQTGNESSDEDCIFAIMTVPVMAVTAVGFGSSAVKGFRDTATCEQENKDARRSEN